jgi:hypothetical protein
MNKTPRQEQAGGAPKDSGRDQTQRRDLKMSFSERAVLGRSINVVTKQDSECYCLLNRLAPSDRGRGRDEAA